MPAATQARLVSAYESGRDVTALLRALFTDEAFASARGQLVKQPVEWLAGALRQVGVAPAQMAARKPRQLVQWLDALGQVPLLPPSVGGWPAGAAWLTTSSALAHLRIATMLAGQAPEATLAQLDQGTEAARADAVARLLAVDAWTDRTRAALRLANGDPRRLLTIALASPEYTIT
jgi:uncharacterized protein (DUF1800 family)